MSTPSSLDRSESGYNFTWSEDLKVWYSTSGLREVLVVPPSKEKGYWQVLVPSTNRAQPFQGEDAEQRAFSVATLYIEQE